MAWRGVTFAELAAGAGIVVAKVVVSAPQLDNGDAAMLAVTWLVTVAFVAVGLSLLQTDLPPVNGWACLLVAASAIPGDLNEPYFAVLGLSTIGYILEPVYMAAAAALVLRYPKASLSSLQRLVVWSMLILDVAARTGAAFTQGEKADGFYPPDDLPGANLPWLHDILFVTIGRAVAAALLLVVAVMLFLRLRRSHGLARQTQAPLVVIGAVCAAAAAVDQLVWAIGPSHFNAPGALVRNITAALIPVALLADLLRRRSAEAQIVRQVLTAAITGDLTRLETAFRDVFVDPTVQVLLDDGHGGWVDGGGRPRELLPAPNRTLRPIHVHTVEDESSVVVAFDPACVHDEALLEAALAAAHTGLQNTRLHADLLAAIAEVRSSRERIVQASLQERRRVERDLHDGAQQQLLAVAATLAQTDLVGDEEVRDVVGQARSGLSVALHELRDLARGIHPPALTQGGLSSALAVLAQRCPIPVTSTLQPPGTAVPDAQAAAIYFLVAESLANATRHARANHIEVTVTIAETHAEILVIDDGVGGARPSPNGGLAGLIDRFAALNGTVRIQDREPGPGTVLRADLPLPAAKS